MPPSLSKDYVSAKSNAKENVRLMMIPGAGHFEIVDPRSGAWATVKNVLLEFVSNKNP